jgi:hypothetical protein|tara:strand:+ start:563 stop:1096 length:534 start_codon:yes stop_codon:yes gene_type:complete
VCSDIKKQLDELGHISDERWERYKELLPETEDVELVVLKGHLIVEEMLYAIAEEHCSDVKAFREARLTFAQLLNVTRAMVKLPVLETCAPIIKKLNTLRNQLMHNLEPGGLDERIYELQELCRVEPDLYPEGYEEPTKPAEVVKGCVCFIAGTLGVAGVVTAFLERNMDLRADSDAS